MKDVLEMIKETFFIVYDLSPERFEGEVVIEDVLFESNFEDFNYQSKGGLEFKKIEGIFKFRREGINFIKKNHPEAWRLLK